MRDPEWHENDATAIAPRHASYRRVFPVKVSPNTAHAPCQCAFAASSSFRNLSLHSCPPGLFTQHALQFENTRHHSAVAPVSLTTTTRRATTTTGTMGFMRQRQQQMDTADGIWTTSPLSRRRKVRQLRRIKIYDILDTYGGA